MLNVKRILESAIRRYVRKHNFDVVRYPRPLPPDIAQKDIETFTSVRDYTETSLERVSALCSAVKYVVAHNIPGDIVECGVWKGGSMMAVARTLLTLNVRDRNLYLFDTFEGMTRPTEKDISHDGERAIESWTAQRRENGASSWCHCSLEDVKQAMYRVGYDNAKIFFVKGKVEATIPARAPDKISLLRLDTDWYESTKHEMVHLFPRLSPGGAIIIDDYGHWQGARLAVDEYLRENKIRLFLNRIDYTGRIGVKERPSTGFSEREDFAGESGKNAQP